MNANVAVSQSEQTLIPRAVTTAIDEVRSAVIRQHDAGQRLLESIVKLYLACRDADVKLTVRELARQTDCSPAYLSQAWRATEKAIAKRRPALEEAGKLGFNKYVKKYVTVRSRSTTVINVAKVDRFIEQFDGMQSTLRARVPTLAVTVQERFIEELLELAEYLKTQLPQMPDRPRETPRRQARH